MPQGGLDRNETPEQAVLREVQEETGIKSAKIISKHPEKYEYEWPDKWHKLNNGYKGQSQAIFYLRYNGDDSDIKIDKTEANDFSWVRIDDVADMVYDKRKEMAKIAVEGYARLRRNN